jgi:hypothetical protein
MADPRPSLSKTAPGLRVPLGEDVLRVLDAPRHPAGNGSRFGLLFRLLTVPEREELRFLRNADDFFRNELSRIGEHSAFIEIRDAIGSFIEAYSPRFVEAARIERALGAARRCLLSSMAPPETALDPLSESMIRAQRHLLSEFQREGPTSDYLRSCESTGSFSFGMLELRDPELASVFKDFLEEYGDRTPGELELEAGTFLQYPERFLKLAFEPSRLPALSKSPSRAVEGPLSRRQAALRSFEQGIHWTRARAMGILRRRVLQLGVRLERTGAVESPGDIFYFRLDEILDLPGPEGRYRDLLFDRRVVLHDRKEADREARKTRHLSGALRGIPLSEIGLEGEPLLCETEAELFNFNGSVAGRVIVLPSAGPGLLHHLPGLGGLICESGSPRSALAGSCRRFGVPAIFGAEGALAALQGAKWVRCRSGSGLIEADR